MPRALAVDWNEVKTLALAIGVREAAKQMGLSVDAVMQRSKRQGWLRDRHEAAALLTPQARTATLAKAHGLSVSKTVSTHPTAAEVLSALGPKSKANLAIAGNKVSEGLSAMSADDLLQADTAQSAKHWTGILATAHGWEKDKTGPVSLSLTFHTGSQPPVMDI